MLLDVSHFLWETTRILRNSRRFLFAQAVSETVGRLASMQKTGDEMRITVGNPDIEIFFLVY